MRPDQVAQLLSEAILAGNGGVPASFERWKQQARLALRATGDEEAVKEFDDLYWAPTTYVLGASNAAEAVLQMKAAKTAIAMLEAQLTLFTSAPPLGPAINVAGLHQWVADAAADQWDNGNHRTAVTEAAREIEIRLRSKLGASGGTLTQMITDAFSTSPGNSGTKRLRFAGFTEGHSDWNDAHEGAMFFGRGCALRIRNLAMHGHEPSEQEALESLAALSLLARWVDDAQVVTTP